jgi:alkanesulfonate monooxygenase SsuD/methylene tetrahydromethanopterin reductase-like flavin-dependent oxidoreductase (luciferase family)
LQFLGITTGMPSQLKPPVDNIDEFWSQHQRASIEKTLDPRTTIVGSPETVKRKLESFIQETKANELIINSQIFNQEDRLRSYELIAEMMD